MFAYLAVEPNGNELIFSELPKRIDEGHNIALSYYYNNYTFADGTPFGVREE